MLLYKNTTISDNYIHLPTISLTGSKAVEEVNSLAMDLTVHA